MCRAISLLPERNKFTFIGGPFEVKERIKFCSIVMGQLIWGRLILIVL
jgi:hypothetical protein